MCPSSTSSSVGTWPSCSVGRERPRTPIRLNDREIRAGELELQIAYKLHLGTRKDFEDAVYVYELTEQTLNHKKLQTYAQDLGVDTEYERLTES